MDGDALPSVLVVSLKELLGGKESAGGRCELVLTLSDFTLDRVGFEAAPGNACTLLPWMDDPMVRDETDRPALDNDGRCTYGEPEAADDDAEVPNLRSGELGTDRARLAPYPYPEDSLLDGLRLGDILPLLGFGGSFLDVAIISQLQQLGSAAQETTQHKSASPKASNCMNRMKNLKHIDRQETTRQILFARGGSRLRAYGMEKRDGALGETSRSAAPAKSEEKQRDPEKESYPNGFGVKICSDSNPIQ